MEEKIKDLNMLLMFLTGWEEDSRKNPGEKIFCILLVERLQLQGHEQTCR
jgi:hypothetical protein